MKPAGFWELIFISGGTVIWNLITSAPLRDMTKLASFTQFDAITSHIIGSGSQTGLSLKSLVLAPSLHYVA